MAYTKLEDASKLKQKLFNWSIDKGKLIEQNRVENKKNTLLNNIQHKIADKLVLSKIRKKMGGNLKFMPCGGAFLENNITEFFRAAGLPIIIGYGLTETMATVTAFNVQRYKLGTVGETMPNVEVKIGENDEILVKGKTVMKGYYNKPEETAEVFKDGWFKTGDAGKFDENNNLIITDRIKDLMKTAGGKYIAPQHIESILTKHNFIEQAIIIGEGKPFVTALLTPNFDALRSWAQKSNLFFENCQDLLNKSQVIARFQEILTELQNNLASFEQVKKFKLMVKEFSIEDGEMTPTFKLKRKIITKKYDALIQEMYKKIIKIN
jgi:long-chain acyl-CoA synthetase